jgi:hypothetical protein
MEGLGLAMTPHFQLEKAPFHVEHEEAAVIAVIGPGPKESLGCRGAEFKGDGKAGNWKEGRNYCWHLPFI